MSELRPGRVVFGPSPAQPMHDRWSELVANMQRVGGVNAQPCNCRGPQPGQTKCPCALRVEMDRADQMLREGVTIAGKRYRLVPDDAP